MHNYEYNPNICPNSWKSEDAMEKSYDLERTIGHTKKRHHHFQTLKENKIILVTHK